MKTNENEWEGTNKMTFEPEITASNPELWDEVSKAQRPRIPFILVAKYVDIHGKMATYTNPYNAKSQSVGIKDLFNGNKYQSDHIIPIDYVRKLPGYPWNWNSKKKLAFYYDLDTQVLIPKDMNDSKGARDLLEYCPPFGRITGASDLITLYQKASTAEKIVVENYCFTWKHIVKKWDIYKYLDSGTKKIITQILKEAKIAGRSPQLINPHY